MKIWIYLILILLFNNQEALAAGSLAHSCPPLFSTSSQNKTPYFREIWNHSQKQGHKSKINFPAPFLKEVVLEGLEKLSSIQAPKTLKNKVKKRLESLDAKDYIYVDTILALAELSLIVNYRELPDKTTVDKFADKIKSNERIESFDNINLAFAHFKYSLEKGAKKGLIFFPTFKSISPATLLRMLAEGVLPLQLSTKKINSFDGSRDNSALAFFSHDLAGHGYVIAETFRPAHRNFKDKFQSFMDDVAAMKKNSNSYDFGLAIEMILLYNTHERFFLSSIAPGELVDLESSGFEFQSFLNREVSSAKKIKAITQNAEAATDFINQTFDL